MLTLISSSLIKIPNTIKYINFPLVLENNFEQINAFRIICRINIFCFSMKNNYTTEASKRRPLYYLKHHYL